MFYTGLSVSYGRVDRTKYQIHIPLPPKIDPSVTMMQVEEKPDVLNDVPDEQTSEIINLSPPCPATHPPSPTCRNHKAALADASPVYYIKEFYDTNDFNEFTDALRINCVT